MLSAAFSRLSSSSRPRPSAHVSRPLPAAVSWCVVGVFPLVARENGAFAFFRAGVVFRFLRHGMDGVGDGLPCRAGWRLWVVVLAFVGSLIPCPLGRGNMCGLRASSPLAVRGSGYFRGSPISRLVVVSSRRLRHHRPSCPMCFVLALSASLASAPVFSCCFLSFFAPLGDEPSGAFLACLEASLRLSSRRLVLLVSCHRA